MDAEGQKVLGTHDSKADAEAHEKAIMAAKHFAEFKPETFSVDGVEVFAAGTWNGDEYSQEHLDGIVAAFADGLKEGIKPYLKLGHDKGQALLQKDGYP